MQKLSRFAMVLAVCLFGLGATRSQEILLAPGEVLIAIDGVPVSSAPTICENGVCRAVTSPVAVSGIANTNTRTLEMVKSAIRSSSSIGPLQKRLLLTRLNRPNVANRVVDAVTSQAVSAGYISVSYDIVSGDAVTLVDWDELAKFLERIIPLIIQLIGLFG
jgi:hypothetical protein